MTRFITLLLFCSFCQTPSYGQSFDTADLDSLFDNLQQHQLAIGSMAVSVNGSIVYQRSFGKGQSSQTSYRIGSVTKLFTAVLIYQLVDKKRLLLHETLDRYFPDLPNAKRITIAALLGHRSGLANFTNHTDYDHWKETPKSHEQLLQMIKDQPVDFEPDAKADYNNSNYLLLSYILEKIYHRPYREIVFQRLINKLGLKGTHYGTECGFQPGEAISYHYVNGNWEKDKAVCLDNFSGAGAIISTPVDLLTFMNALFTGRLISAASLDSMKNMRDGYGKGLFPYGDKDHPGYGHNGKTEGFGASLQYYPQNKVAIAYCTNGEVYPKAEILDDIFKIAFHLPFRKPSFQVLALPASLLDTYAGQYHSSGGDMQVSVVHQNGQLVLTTKGQSFVLSALSAFRFWNTPFGFFFDFNKGGTQLNIVDVDDMYTLYKD